MREVEENCVKSIKFVEKFDMTRNRKIYLTIGALIALLILVGYWLVPLRHYEGDETRIYIPKGATTDAIKDSLTSALGQEFGGEV